MPSCSNVSRSTGVYSYQDMFPVLHEEDICLVHHQQLDGGEEVKVSLAFSFCSQHCAEAQWRRDDDV